MSSGLYTDTDGSGKGSDPLKALRKMLGGGAGAVKEAAERAVPPAYYLQVEVPEALSLSVRVRPSVLGGSTSVHADVTGASFELVVTAVYDARAATRAATRLMLLDDEYEAVNRLVEARTFGGEVALFVRAFDMLGKVTVPIVRSVIRAFFDLGVAGESALVILHSDLGFGSPLYARSSVSIGTLRNMLTGERVPKERHVQTLFEGGEWAFRKESEYPLSLELHLEATRDTPELSVTVTIHTRMRHTAGVAILTAPHAFVEVAGVGSDMSLIALRKPSDVLAALEAYWKQGPAYSAVGLMNKHKVARGMTIFAWADRGAVFDAPWPSSLRRVLRTLYDLKLTAQEEHTDALVIVRLSDGRLKASRLLSLINAGFARLMPREIRSNQPRRMSRKSK